MNKLLILATMVGLTLFPAVSSATSPEASPPDSPDATTSDQRQPKFEMQNVVALGGPIGLTVWDTEEKTHTLSVTAVWSQRLRLPRYTPLGLEVAVVAPAGPNVSVLLDMVRVDRFRFHVNAGIFWPVVQPISVGNLPRTHDLSFGAGLEIPVIQNLGITVDWRAFMPKPRTLITKYGVFADPIVDESLKGGQLWLGTNVTW